MNGRLEEIFREEARRTLGAKRLSLEELARAISDFMEAAPPEEVGIFGKFILTLASGISAVAELPAPAPVAAAPDPALSTVAGALAAIKALKSDAAAGRPAASPVPMAQPPARRPGVPPWRPGPAPFRVSYPVAASRPRAVPPEPHSPPETEPSPDDIEDFSVPATTVP